jgi:hypothetical protein
LGGITPEVKVMVRATGVATRQGEVQVLAAAKQSRPSLLNRDLTAYRLGILNYSIGLMSIKTGNK